MKKGFSWHVIYTKSRQEKKVAEFLNEKGIEYYLPTITVLKQWSDRKKKVEEVLFKSYVFVCVDEKNYYDALKANGAVRYVSFKGKAAIIPDKQMDLIKNAIDNKLEFDVSTEFFSKGKTVKIGFGPFKGITGEIVAWSGKKKLLIRIQEIGYSLLVKISPEDIERG